MSLSEEGRWPPCAPRSHGRTARSPGCPPASPRKPQTCSLQRGTTSSVSFCHHISTRAITRQFVHTLPAGASSRCTHGPRSNPGRRQPTRSLQVAPRRSPPSSTCSPPRDLPPGAGHPSAGLACVCSEDVQTFPSTINMISQYHRCIIGASGTIR